MTACRDCYVGPTGRCFFLRFSEKNNKLGCRSSGCLLALATNGACYQSIIDLQIAVTPLIVTSSLFYKQSQQVFLFIYILKGV